MVRHFTEERRISLYHDASLGHKYDGHLLESDGPLRQFCDLPLLDCDVPNDAPLFYDVYSVTASIGLLFCYHLLGYKMNTYGTCNFKGARSDC